MPPYYIVVKPMVNKEKDEDKTKLGSVTKKKVLFIVIIFIVIVILMDYTTS